MVERKEIKFKTKRWQTAFLEGIKKRNDGLPSSFRLVEGLGRSKYNDWFVSLLPSHDNKLKKICLLCGIEKDSYFCYSVKETSNLQSHIQDFHQGVYLNDPDAVESAKDVINNVIESKRFRRSATIIKQEGKGKKPKLFRDYSALKYLEAIWVINRNRRDLIVNDTEKRAIKKFLVAGSPTEDRKTTVRTQTVVHGFKFETIEKRIKKSAEFLNHKPFIALQGDAWTAQNNKTY